MKIIFLGVGEPWDENLHNVSLFVEGKNANLLLDCGYDSYKNVFRYNKDANYLDAIYISHFHGDHDAGIPPLLSMLWVNDRNKSLTIIGQTGIENRVMHLIKTAFPELIPILNNKYSLNFLEVGSGIEKEIIYRGLRLKFAETKHSTKNLAIRINEGEKGLCYSGDGDLTENTIKLYSNRDLLIHDAYLLKQGGEKTTGHGDIVSLIDMAEKENIKNLAFVNVEKGLLSKQNDILKKFGHKKVKLIFPKEGQEIRIQ